MKEWTAFLRDLAWLLAGIGALTKAVLDIIDWVRKRRSARATAQLPRSAARRKLRRQLLVAIGLGLLGAAAIGYGLARLLTPVPLPDGCRQDGESHVVCTARTKCLSGIGKRWTDDEDRKWCSLASIPPPSHYFLTTDLADATFKVIGGDHVCQGNGGGAPRLADPGRGKPAGAGSWAECYQERRDESGVTWAFRIQGWEGNAQRGEGVAQLVTRYTRR